MISIDRENKHDLFDGILRWCPECKINLHMADLPKHWQEIHDMKKMSYYVIDLK